MTKAVDQGRFPVLPSPHLASPNNSDSRFPNTIGALNGGVTLFCFMSNLRNNNAMALVERG